MAPTTDRIPHRPGAPPGASGEATVVLRVTASTWRMLRSARFALGVLVFLAAYCGIGATLPTVDPSGSPSPPWRRALGLDRPFASAPFLAAVGLLLASTLACTTARVPRVVRAWRGGDEGRGEPLPERPGRSVDAFLRSRGLRPGAPGWVRFRWALWGGTVLHVGLLALILAVLVQQAVRDGGVFELAVGEVVNLADDGVVLARSRGPLAPATPPDLEIGLLDLDPFRHQPGYAPDRWARVRVGRPGELPREIPFDRARGIEASGTTLYQALPFGLAISLEVAGDGLHSVHLRTVDPWRAETTVTAPGGAKVAITASSERPLDDPYGTGAISVGLVVDGVARELGLGQPFPFGTESARIVGFGRWAGFSYSRTPGMAAVHLGFALVLVGSLLLAFPAAVVRRSGTPGQAGWVVAARDPAALAAAWREWGSSSVEGGEVE